MGFTLKDAFVEFDSVDISAYVRSVTMSLGLVALEAGTMGDDAETFQPGLKQREVSCTVRPTYAAGEFDATMWSKFDAGTTGTLKIRPSSDAIGAGNPEFSGTFFISSYPGISGDHGQKAEGELTFSLAAGDFARATS